MLLEPGRQPQQDVQVLFDGRADLGPLDLHRHRGASAATMKIIATISGTPSATLKNTARCPDSAARSAWPTISAATNPTRPAISARSAVI
jgi:hypothetical protein